MTTIDLPLVDRPETGAVAGCCAPAAGDVVDPAAARDLARQFKALADPTRVQLLSIVTAHEGHEACVCDLTEPVGLSQPTVSHHLKILVEAGLLEREQRGRWAYYRAAPGAVAGLVDSVSTLMPSPATASA
ncbi:ArsR/SmtB family transcription factor [Krasilnikoviella flava]|uniref:Transcriptional regulator, ArsR family n=1 Tax=Krasilnikoviella flava TaxID=526729 RepID=A0A1T5K9F3_9MICO|nr:metalloregulator ArsR/SmtB family transcription factor [Krasilnikoviella flava]SKC60327.1 transcriptional regulator, ArsR family [Krasilnikoviella flava]